MIIGLIRDSFQHPNKTLVKHGMFNQLNTDHDPSERWPSLFRCGLVWAEEEYLGALLHRDELMIFG